MNQAMSRGTLVQLANTGLEPERQRGYEAGTDLYFTRGGFIKATWYDQRAIDLIQQVRVRRADTTKYQFQNVGAVRNRGVEIEAGVRAGRLTLNGIASIPHSRVERVSPQYEGALRAGDRLLEVPDGAGALSARYDAGRVHAEVGATWTGEWIGYDWEYVRRVDRQQAAPRSTEREYWKAYPSVTRPYVTLSFDLPREYRAYVRADNPANSSSVVRDNLSPPLGRMVVLGLSRR